MCIYWDTCTLTIVNNTPFQLTAQASTVNSGSWNPAPANIAAGATGTFGANSQCSILAGPDGQANYILPDNTTIEVAFSVPYLAGNNPNSQATANGVRGQGYTLTSSAESTSSTCGGAGKNYVCTWTLTTVP